MALTVDEALQRVGTFGRFQILFLVFSNCLRWVWSGWPIMVMTFLSAEPPWQCVANSTVCTFSGVIDVGDENYDKRCNMSRGEWEFSREFTSVVSEFDLVCNKAVYSSISRSVFFGGWLLTLLFSSVLSDKFGRKKVMFAFAAIICVSSFTTSFSVNFLMFAVFRTLTGVGRGGFGMPQFVLLTEFANPKNRSMMANSLFYCWSLSLIALAGVAYLVRDWSTLALVTSVPGIPFLLGYFFYPESVRWLAIRNRTAEATKIFNKIARINRKEPLDEPLQSANENEKGERMGDFRDLFASRRLAHRTLLSWYSWFAASMMYYGVALSAPAVGGNMYLNFFLTSVIEIPGIYLGIKAYNKFGRKLSVVVSLVFAAVAAACAVIIREYGGSGQAATGGRIFFSMVVAKFFALTAFDGLYLYSAELFPTVIRNVGLGTSSLAARVGSLSAPYVVFTRRTHPLLPYGIMGINALIAAVICMTGPETNNQPTEEFVGRAKYSANNSKDPEVAIESDKSALVANKA